MKSRITYTKIILLVISIILIWSFFNIKVWKNAEQQHKLIDQDVVHYYCYLPALFVHHDLSFKFVDKDGIDYRGQSKFWPSPAKNGGYVVKMTMGLSYMYLPFFAGAHVFAQSTDKYKSNGFSAPYEFALTLSSIFYVIVGFVFLRLILLRYFSEIISSSTMLCLLIGTNLYYYCTSEPAMSHAYSFCLFAIFIYQSIQWHDKRKLKNIVFLGLIGGLIILIRPVNALIFIFPLFYKVVNLSDLQERGKLFWQHKYHLILLFFCALLIIFPQLLFWKINSGEWMYYSYDQERFFFLNPHIYYGLFSYRKGWLLYTPIMIFSIIGIVILLKQKQDLFAPLAIFLPLHVYVTFSWWCWWYGGSFGSRPMIETYALLAIALAAFLEYITKQKLWVKGITTVIFLFLTTLNLVQTAQKRETTIHWDSMTKEAYWKNFMQVEDVGGIWNTFRTPNYKKALQGREEYNTLGNEIKWLKEKEFVLIPSTDSIQ